MKIFLTLPLFVTSAVAFAPASGPFGVASCRSTTTTSLFASRVDSSDAVKAALEASKKYGPASPEARIAWEAVEEMDASDNSVATEGAVRDVAYEEKVAALSALLQEQKEKIQAVRNLAEEIKAVKMPSPSRGSSSVDSAELRKALADAKKATNDFGKDSAEARLAWEAVEELASSDQSEVMKGKLDDECLVEAIEGCEAIEELSRALETANLQP